MSAPKPILNSVAVALYFFTCAIQLSAQTAVPIEKEPMHRLRFENEFVRVFDVLIPAGKSTLLHTHALDGVGVRVSNADMAEEYPSGDRKTFAAKWGEASFGSGPIFSHTVINRGKTDFRNIYVELMVQNAPAKTGAVPVLSDRHIILIDNPRVRVNRLVLKPGESSTVHTHSMNGLGITLYDAKVEITKSVASPQVHEVKAGDFVWQKAGTTHVIRNIGSTVFEAIDIELK
ncbi:MAG TPA: hypothetical protein VFZ23_02855 [Pyrinomonadaceae bacterium]